MPLALSYCSGGPGREELEVLGTQKPKVLDLTTGEVLATRGTDAEPEGRFPGSSMTKTCVRG